MTLTTDQTLLQKLDELNHYTKRKYELRFEERETDRGMRLQVALFVKLPEQMILGFMDYTKMATWIEGFCMLLSEDRKF